MQICVKLFANMKIRDTAVLYILYILLQCFAMFFWGFFLHRVVVLPLVALPTCGCQCHKCPYQRGKVILLGTSCSARTLVSPSFAAAQENTISCSKLTVHITATRLKLKPETFFFLGCSCRAAHGGVCG